MSSNDNPIDRFKLALLAAGLDAPTYLRVLGPYLEVAPGDETGQSAAAGSFEHLIVTLNKDSSPESGRSIKAHNILINLRKVVIERDLDLAGDFLEVPIDLDVLISGLKNSNLMAIVFVLKLLADFHKLARRTITSDEALVMVEIYRLELEENTIRVEDLLRLLKGKLPEERIMKALVALDALGCIIVSMGEIVRTETIEFRLDNA